MKYKKHVASVNLGKRISTTLRVNSAKFLLGIFFSILSAVAIGITTNNQVYSADSTEGYYDCGTSWPVYYNGEECYIRGTYQPYSGWINPPGCSGTNMIVYPNTGQYYYFCDPARTAQLTGHEVIGFVRWNGNGTFVIIDMVELAEVFNQPPNQPSMYRPQSGWLMGPRTNGDYTGVNCSTSGTGQGCSVGFVTTSHDPDFYQWIRLEAQVTKDEGGNHNYNQQLNSNDQTNIQPIILNDGHWNFRARNCDTAGECSGWTSPRVFIVDTTAPTGVTMNSEPEFTPSTQNAVSSTAGTDNLIGGIQYNFQVDDDPTFGSPDNESGWISTNSFTFAGLTDETQYYYRVIARDSLHNVGSWSSSVTSTQDATPPQINNVTITHQRISPQNQDGEFDDTQLGFEWTEKYSLETRLEVVDAGNNIVRTITDTLPTGSTTPLPHQFTWDGKDDTNTLVPDGPYTMRIEVEDKAGNISTNDSEVVIVDNIPADINVSLPIAGSWFNQANITINGQTEADADAEITNSQTSITTSLVLDPLGIFSHDDILEMGPNFFVIDVEDVVKNSNQLTLDYYREESDPDITSLAPTDIINNRQPAIELDLLDIGYNDGADDYISGIDPDNIFISLTHPDTGELVLVNNGVNTQSSLGAISQNCDTAGTYGNSGPDNCIYTFQFTADINIDGDYTITARSKDEAGNSATEKTQDFELDSNILSNLTAPSNGDLFNYSLITLNGTAEKNSEITISLPLGDLDGDSTVDSETFIANDSASNSARVNITNCRPSSDPTQDGIIEICDWEVTDFQLERDTANPGNVTNQISVEAQDNIDLFPGVGLNTKTDNISVNVDLYAVTLTVDSDIEYFSPNGDGNQDGINFTEISTNGQSEAYILEIKNDQGDVVRSFTAGGTPPAEIPWDGRDENGDFVPDGTYTYQLKIRTTDGIDFETTPQPLYAVTELNGTVIITYPKNDSYSSRGVITVQGQAPQSLVTTSSGTDSELEVKICVDTMSITGTCDMEYYTTVDGNGFFSAIVMLPRINPQDEHYITATALDKYGNETPPSNQVKVTTTINPPFESIEIIPVLSGTNDPAAYQVILDKLDSGEEITQADIDSLRSVILRSTVFQGTERVKLSFADHSGLSQLPDTTNWNYIGYITGDNKTNLYKPFVDGTTSYNMCSNTTCTWDFYYPLAPQLQGIYEIEFEGKLDVEVQRLTAGFTVDGNIPVSPIILDIDKIVDGNPANTKLYDGDYYSNSEIIQIKGASDPNAEIEVQNASGTTICTTTASSVGIWSCQVDTSTIPAYSSPNTNVYTIPLTTYATLGLNTSQSAEDKTVIIDKIAPQFQDVTTSTLWRKSGDVVDIDLVANESLGYAISIDQQDPSDPDQCINSSATFDLLGTQVPVQMGAIDDLVVDSGNLAHAAGSYVISGYAVEGRYCTTLKIYDLAGNSAQTGQILFIDNTTPETPYIDTTLWGKFNGIDTEPKMIADGRLVPEFVHEEDKVQITAWTEENTILEFYVNAKLLITSSPVSGGCKVHLAADKEFDTVIVQDKDICSHTFNYTMTQNGADYVFQVKAIDRSGNKSIISEDEVIYYDIQNPINPEVIRTSGPSYDPTPGWILGLKNSITKDLSIKLHTHAESLSDLEYTVSGPQNFSKYIFTQTPGDSVKKQDIPLGSTTDERNGCVQLQGTRRTGVCQDGNYSVLIKSTDAAGNPSGTTKHMVERDTVKPAKPTNVELKIDDYSYTLNLFAKGEINATVVVKISGAGHTWYQSKATDSNGNASLYNLVGSYAFSTKYKAEVYIMDIARNTSPIVTVEIITPDPPVGAGQGDEPADPYGGSKLEDLGDITFRVDIKLEDGSYEISDLKIPAPKLTKTKTDFEGKVDTYGIGYPESKTKAKAKIYTTYMTHTEALKHCKTNEFIVYYVGGEKRKCVEEAMGIDDIWAWRWETAKECGLAVPIYSSICFAKKLNNKRETKYDKTKDFTLDKVETVIQNKTKGEKVATVKPNEQGQFNRQDTLGDKVNKDDIIRAFHKIKGDFKYKDIKISLKDKKSSYSNELTIKGKPNFSEVVVSPVKDCPGAYWTSGFGPRCFLLSSGEMYCDVHDGVDISQAGGCNISSVYKGDAWTDGSYGTTVKVKHNEKFKTYYGHAKETTGVYPRTVITGETIMYMGQTGFADGIHLHFMVLEDGKAVDPKNYFSKYLDALPKDCSNCN